MTDWNFWCTPDLSKVALLAAKMGAEDSGMEKKGWKIDVISADHQNELDVGFDIAKRFSERMSNKSMPTMVHAGVYAAIIHYLKTVDCQGGNSHDGTEIVAAMKAVPSDGPLFGKGSIELNGRAIHPAYLFKVKKPSESMGP